MGYYHVFVVAYLSVITFHLVLSSTLEQAMNDHNIVPDVIDTAPSNMIEVNYLSGAVVNLGNELTPTQVKDTPTVQYPSEAGALYTLCMTDPDAPSRQDPKFGEWLHWLIVNIPGGDVAKGEIINDYVGSGPPKGTGLHRYVFLAYKQPGNLTVDEPRHSKNSGKNRNNFKIRNFAKKYNLGDPVAGNFYQAQWDDYVPKLYQQLKD